MSCGKVLADCYGRQLRDRRCYAVCINYLQGHDEAAQVVKAIPRDGGTAIAMRADARSEPEAVVLFQAVDNQLGPATALANNAATLERQMRIDEMDEERLRRIFAVNFIGPFLCAREAARRNVHSSRRQRGKYRQRVLGRGAASKGAVDTFTIVLAVEVAEEVVRVNGVRPGFSYTDLHAKGGEPGGVDRVKSLVPMMRRRPTREGRGGDTLAAF